MSSYDERDDFWDLDKLVPKKRKIISPFASVSKTVTYSAPGEEDRSAEERKLSLETLKGIDKTEDTSYVNEGAGLVKRVTIKRFIDKYDFYGSFRKAALLYYDYKTEKCAFAPFYSYMPQYSQLNTEQKNYYFFWRDSLRHGIYLKSDYSYLYLCVYEILNLPDKIPPEQGIDLLCSLWSEYREALPRIDSYFARWVQDYCLVYRLPCPTEKIRSFISEAISVSDFKEFYLSDIDKTGDDGTDAMLAYLSDYDWRKGKYSGGENADVYRKYMLGAMWRVLYRLDLKGTTGGSDIGCLRRDAFAHSLCTHAVKCKLEVEYLRLSGNERIRLDVTSAVRYTENKLRALFGIKSRLAVKALSDEHKHIIDLYFNSLFEKEMQRRRAENIPEYEKLYDAPRESLSFSGADEIERASWVTTKRLVVESECETDFDEMIENTGNTEESISIEDAKEPAEASGDAPTYGLSLDDVRRLYEISVGNYSIDDTAAERINEAFADGFGDIILEYDGEKYRIIEDYEEEIGEWLLKIMK